MFVSYSIVLFKIEHLLVC